MEIVIIKYNAGNIGSVANALNRLGARFSITDDKEAIAKADRVIFPGVGEASTTMQHLQETGLDQVIKDLKQPVLGICLGMQLMCSYSEEGKTKGLGIFSEKILKFNIGEKIPHMGWNRVDFTNSTLFDGLEEDPWFYFVHSFYAEIGPSCLAKTSYEISFASALQKENFFAAQFHPEKSAKNGEILLNNFIQKSWK